MIHPAPRPPHLARLATLRINMRLLNTRVWELKDFQGSSIPPYAILSHTWGVEEISLQDLVKALPCLDRREPTSDGLELKKGFWKIQHARMQADQHHLPWVWIDTCCIDKTSSAELSEAINSMFKWYRDSRVCYAYLEDVEDQEDPELPESSFGKSRWFTRGWTLQELLAPQEVLFFSTSWSLIKNLHSLCEVVERVSRISSKFLKKDRPSIYKASVAQRMAWASRRQTTRVEDIAYCLLGIFDINMPLLYGEGDKAFKRLQEEIAKVSNDQSLFAWGLKERCKSAPKDPRVLARAAWEFSGCEDVITCDSWHRRHYPTTSGFEMTKMGLRIELPVVWLDCEPSTHGSRYQMVAMLKCRFAYDFDHFISIPLGSPQRGRFVKAILSELDGGFQAVRFSDFAARSAPAPEPWVDLSDHERWPLHEKQSLFALLYITERSEFEDNELTPRLLGRNEGLDNVLSYAILLRGDEYTTFSDLKHHHEDVEILARGSNFIFKERRLPSQELPISKNTTYAHFSCTYKELEFIVRIEVCDPDEKPYSERLVKCLLTVVPKAEDIQDATWLEPKWAKVLHFGLTTIHSRVEVDEIMGTSVVTVCFYTTSEETNDQLP